MIKMGFSRGWSYKDKDEMYETPLSIYKGTWWSWLKYVFIGTYYYLYKSQEGWQLETAQIFIYYHLLLVRILKN